MQRLRAALEDAEIWDEACVAVGAIYEHLGWPLVPAAVAAMEAWQAGQAKRRRHEVRYSYDLNDYDLTPEAIDAAFSRYRDFIASRGIRT